MTRLASVAATIAATLALGTLAAHPAPVPGVPTMGAPMAACAWHAGTWESVPCHYVGPGTHGTHLDLIILAQPTTGV